MSFVEKYTSIYWNFKQKNSDDPASGAQILFYFTAPGESEQKAGPNPTKVYTNIARLILAP